MLVVLYTVQCLQMHDFLMKDPSLWALIPTICLDSVNKQLMHVRSPRCSIQQKCMSGSWASLLCQKFVPCSPFCKGQIHP